MLYSYHIVQYKVVGSMSFERMQAYVIAKRDIATTVVPALGDPAVSGHMPCTVTLSMSQHISTLNYLQSADTCGQSFIGCPYLLLYSEQC